MESPVVSSFDEALRQSDSRAISQLISSVVLEREKSSERWKLLSERVSSLGEEDGHRFLKLHLGFPLRLANP